MLTLLNSLSIMTSNALTFSPGSSTISGTSDFDLTDPGQLYLNWPAISLTLWAFLYEVLCTVYFSSIVTRYKEFNIKGRAKTFSRSHSSLQSKTVLKIKSSGLTKLLLRSIFTSCPCHANNLKANRFAPLWEPLCSHNRPPGRGRHSRVERSRAQHQLRLVLLQVLKPDTEPGCESMQGASFLDIKAQLTFHCLCSSKQENRHGFHKHMTWGRRGLSVSEN